MAASLEERLDALPTELYKKIFELIFTTNCQVHTIEKTYKPPSCLQVSRSTRASFAKSYYGRGVAGKDDANVTMFYIDRDECPKWLESLPQDHVDMLEEVRYRDYGITLWAGSSKEVLQGAYDKDGWGIWDSLMCEIGHPIDFDQAQLYLPCRSVDWSNWKPTTTEMGGQEKYRSLADLENGLWSDLAKDDVPDFEKK